MLFNSFVFLYLYLPLALAGYFAIARLSREAAMLWLLVASIFFYGWWDSRYVALLVGSIVFNYMAGAAIAGSKRYRGSLLAIAIVANLAVLSWYKYANFFGSSVGALLGQQWHALDIILPLGISFFTFTQIAFLVDVWKGEVKEYNFVHYALFVTYFPHLIAGPVLHHKEMMPQFRRAVSYRPNLDDLTTGLLLFCIGLFKKVVLADSIQPYVAPVFDAPPGASLTLDEAWAGALAYTFQLYFDFSGYSDMAVGLSRMFGIVLPLNFNSPYKAVDLIEFWRRWHMTLSRFLRDYLYIPLGGNRKGVARRYLNLLATMLLGGLWHGANWTFVIWGGLHGVYLIVNHAWLKFRGIDNSHVAGPFGHALAVVATFLAVVIAWVFFRAQTFDAAWRVLSAMAGSQGCHLPWETSALFQTLGCVSNTREIYSDGNVVWLWICFSFAVVWGLPNSQQITESMNQWLFRAHHGGARKGKYLLASMLMGALLVGLVVLSAISGSRGASEFIYFNF
ncbi:MAG: MBOAT family protein [Thiobacillus sp.]|nr:MBOAT family protein [Thiobacillus sp.]